MSDPRNDAHKRKVSQKKKSGAPDNAASAADNTVESVIPAAASVPAAAPELEGSLVILAQLKDLAFHANAHQGRLAEMMLTVEDKLKQKDFAATVGDLYSAQAALHDKLTELVTAYSSECDRLQGGGQ